MDPKVILDALRRPSGDEPMQASVNIGATPGPLRRRSLDAEDIGAIITRHHNEGHSEGWDEGYHAGLEQVRRATEQAAREGETLGALTGLKLAIDSLSPAIVESAGEELKEVATVLETLRETFATVNREGLHGERKGQSALERKMAQMASTERVGW